MKITKELISQRKQNVSKINYENDLPISQNRDKILELIKKHNVVVIAGNTGSGKTTQLPKICLEAGLGISGMIGHTQPRRLAARSVASRIAEELKVELGKQVGYQVRFNDKTSKKTLIKLMTDGVLLNEIQQDPNLYRYDTLIIDEAHERSLNIDFILGYLKKLLIRRPDLKIIITSATIDHQRFADHFDKAAVIEISGRTFPVETIYRPLDDIENINDKDQKLFAGILNAIKEIETLELDGSFPKLGDILVFLSGEREIREYAKKLRYEQLKNTSILPLYARLSSGEQQKIFHPLSRGRRIILATNVAETSLTVPGIQYVIDSGFARISRYSIHSRIQRLPIEPISQASADQRKGRCGRIAHGLCIRLFSEEDFNNRPKFTDPEILRTSLASVILQMLSIRLGDIEKFPFIDMPENRSIKDGFNLLYELWAVNKNKQLTMTGKKMARLAVDPRLARMLVEANVQNSLYEVLIIVSSLSIQDPRERPSGYRQQADEKHKTFQDEVSDFMSLVNLWEWYEEQRSQLSQSQLRTLCKKYFLNFLRMREWRDIHRQLLLMCKHLHYQLNEESANYTAIHKALLSGLLSNIGVRDDDADYQGLRNRKFWVSSSSTLHSKKTKWCMTAQLIETTKVYAHMVAKIYPQWIEPLAGQLVKAINLEPYWSSKRCEVLVKQNITLYGLIIGSRTVSFANIDPVKAREIFIRSGLVEQNFTTSFTFFNQNKKTIADVEAMEDKIRKRDILVDDEIIFEFYNQRIPSDVVNRITLEKWLRSNQANQKILCFKLNDLQCENHTDINETNYPTYMYCEGIKLPLTYVFDPDSKNDGVTVCIPLQLLTRFPEYRAEWLTPALLYEKIVCLIRSLPKAIRKNFIPVPHFTKAILEDLTPCNEPLLAHLTEKLYRMTGVKVDISQWNLEFLDKHLQMNFKVLDENGKYLAQGKNLKDLQFRFSERAQQCLSEMTDSEWEKPGLITWSFGELPQSIEIKKQGMVFIAYPGLVDQNSSVDLTVFESKEKAKYETRFGLLKLVILTLEKQLKNIVHKTINLDKIALLSFKSVTKDQLKNTILFSLIYQIFYNKKITFPHNKNLFDRCINNISDHCVKEAAQHLETLLLEIFSHYHNIMKQLKKKMTLQMAFSMSDIKCQLENLITPTFLKEVPWEWLQEYPRYLKAIELRLEKMPLQVRKDQLFAEDLQNRWQMFYEKKMAMEKHSQYSEPLNFYRWMLEEYRVSFFAQQLKTKHSVSEKKLDTLWDGISSHC